jgi:aryl-alcohol dehydrogenase-like predicted oxidoreductase
VCKLLPEDDFRAPHVSDESSLCNPHSTQLFVKSPKTHVKNSNVLYLRKGSNPYGFGTMGLGVCYPVERPSRAVSIGLIHKAIHLGCRFFDTADTYCRNTTDLHYTEELLRDALCSYPDKEVIKEVRIATKGGMDRRGASSSSWRTPSKLGADELEARIRASHRALGLREDRRPIFLYQLHHPQALGEMGGDNFRSALERVRTLMEEGVVLHFGLCNTSVQCLEAAMRIVRVSSVQNTLSLYDHCALLPPSPTRPASANERGVLQFCKDHDILFIAYAVLGGLRARDGRRCLEDDYPHLTRMAAGYGPEYTAHTACLAWVRRLAPQHVLVITGHRSLRTVQETQLNALRLCHRLSDTHFTEMTALTRAPQWSCWSPTKATTLTPSTPTPVVPFAAHTAGSVASCAAAAFAGLERRMLPPADAAPRWKRIRWRGCDMIHRVLCALPCTFFTE